MQEGVSYVDLGVGCENCGQDSWRYELNDTKAVIVLGEEGREHTTQLCPKCGRPLLKGGIVRTISL